MRFVDRTLRAQRVALGVAVAGSALAFTRASLDVFNTTKATVVVVAALAVGVIGAVRVVRTRRVQHPATPLRYALAAFVVALVVATIVSDTPLRSVAGDPGRHTGLVLYAACAALMLAAVRLYRDRPPDGLLAAILAAAAPISVYALAQAAGADPLGWRLVEGGPPVFSTFGNANFLAAWLGVVLPLAALGAARRRWPARARVACGALSVVMVAAMLATTSLQGPAAAAAGLALLGGVWLVTSGHPWRWPLLVGGGALAAVGLAGVAAGVGPLEGVRAAAARSLETRVAKWETALLMARDRPLLGYGLDAFGDWFHAYRPPALAAETGLERTTDAPHMVYLDMLVSGGAVLAVAHLAVLAVVAASLLSGLRRTSGQQRLVLAGLGGAWVGYLVQALVSIDVPPLAVTGWVLGGLVVAVGAQPALHDVALPGAPERRGKGTRLADAHPALVGLLAAGTAAAVWALTLPVRADLVGGQAARAETEGDRALAAERWERAARVAPWEPRYPARHGTMAMRDNDLETALARLQEAAARQPRGLAHWVNIGRTAAALENDDLAASAFDRALELDPYAPAVLVEVARHHIERGDLATAEALLDRALTIDPDDEAAAAAREELTR